MQAGAGHLAGSFRQVQHQQAQTSAETHGSPINLPFRSPRSSRCDHASSNLQCSVMLEIPENEHGIARARGLRGSSTFTEKPTPDLI